MKNLFIKVWEAIVSTLLIRHWGKLVFASSSLFIVGIITQLDIIGWLYVTIVCTFILVFFVGYIYFLEWIYMKTEQWIYAALPSILALCAFFGVCIKLFMIHQPKERLQYVEDGFNTDNALYILLVLNMAFTLLIFTRRVFICELLRRNEMLFQH